MNREAVKDYKLFIYVFIMCVLSTLFLMNKILALALVGVQLIILASNISKKNMNKYFINYFIFTVSSYEFGFYARGIDFYNFKNIRLFGFNVALLALIPPILHLIFQKYNFKKIKRENKELYKVILIFSIFMITGVLFGLLTVLLNDNNIQIFESLPRIFIERVYFFLIPMITIIWLSFINMKKPKELLVLKKAILYVLISIVITKIFALVFGIYGYSRGVKILMLPEIHLFTPFLALIPLYDKEYKRKIYFYILALVSSIMTLIFNPSGKALILIVVVPFVYLVIAIKKRKIFQIFAIVLSMIGVGLLISSYFLRLAEINIMVSNKMYEVKGLIQFWVPGWFENMPQSPRYRIAQFLNILIEYVQKPFYYFFGKGFIGTYKDYVVGFTGGYESAFSFQEYVNDTYYYAHDAINVILLAHGFFGFASMIYFVKSLVKNGKKSIWIVIGVFWFLTFYGFSLTISIFGATCLFMGFNDLGRVCVLQDNTHIVSKNNERKFGDG